MFFEFEFEFEFEYSWIMTEHSERRDPANNMMSIGRYRTSDFRQFDVIILRCIYVILYWTGN